MKWIIKSNVEPFVGDYRTSEGFLFLPKRIGNQVRWLEHASWRERYSKTRTFVHGDIEGDGPHYVDGAEWRPVRWNV